MGKTLNLNNFDNQTETLTINPNISTETSWGKKGRIFSKMNPSNWENYAIEGKTQPNILRAKVTP